MSRLEIKINADVIDLTSYNPTGCNSYFVDTNVWTWLAYCAGKQFPLDVRAPKDYQLLDYPKFLQDILDKGCKIYHSGLVLSELASVIESFEHKIF